MGWPGQVTDRDEKQGTGCSVAWRMAGTHRIGLNSEWKGVVERGSCRSVKLVSQPRQQIQELECYSCMPSLAVELAGAAVAVDAAAVDYVDIAAVADCFAVAVAVAVAEH